MSRKYKMRNSDGAYFVSFATVYWIDVFIRENQQESRREWLLWMFSRAAEKRGNVQKYQFWQHHNQPIEIYSQKFFDEKLNYIHQNPVVSSFVCDPWEWKYSSTRNYCGMSAVLDIDIAV